MDFLANGSLFQFIKARWVERERSVTGEEPPPGERTEFQTDLSTPPGTVTPGLCRIMD